jgi:predicted transposase/invertase (TIGR01784 family)
MAFKLIEKRIQTKKTSLVSGRNVEKKDHLKYNSTAMNEIDRIHDKFFRNVFGDVENTKIFLKIALPTPIRKSIDFSKISIDPTNYVSQKFKEGLSDIVAKTIIRSREGKEAYADIYILFEHKSYRDKNIFAQLLLYMYLMWQKDIDEDKPLRVIIPLVFYHGSEKWTIPLSFVDQFDVNDEIREFLLDYRYVLFDTRDWDFREEKNEELKNNVFLLTALAMMKSAFNDDWGTILEIFRFWYERGFFREQDKILFFLIYLSETRNIGTEELKKILEENKIYGGEIMQTLAQRFRDEGKEKWMNEGKEKWMKEGKLETARKMLYDGVSIENIAKYTGLLEEEIKRMLH